MRFKNKGFTIVELGQLFVAAGIIGLIGLVIWVLWHFISKLW